MRFISPTLSAALIANVMGTLRPTAADQLPARNVAKRGILGTPVRDHLIALIARVVIPQIVRTVPNGWKKSRFKKLKPPTISLIKRLETPSNHKTRNSRAMLEL